MKFCFAILFLHGSHRSYPSRRRACFLIFVKHRHFVDLIFLWLASSFFFVLVQDISISKLSALDSRVVIFIWQRLFPLATCIFQTPISRPLISYLWVITFLCAFHFEKTNCHHQQQTPHIFYIQGSTKYFLSGIQRFSRKICLMKCGIVIIKKCDKKADIK